MQNKAIGGGANGSSQVARLAAWPEIRTGGTPHEWENRGGVMAVDTAPQAFLKAAGVPCVPKSGT